MKKAIFLSLITLIVIVGAIVIYAKSKQDDNRQSELIKLTYAENKVLPFPHPAVIAEQKGFFQEEGLDVDFASFNTGKEAFNAMLSGDAQIAHVAETPVVFLGFTDDSVQIFARIVHGHNVKILARKDKGITNPSDLKGKKIAAPKGTSADFALSEFLKVNGLNSSDIEFINLSPMALPAALLGGQVDAYAIWEPHVYVGQQALGTNAVTFPIEKIIYETQTSMAAKIDWLDENPETAKKFLKALIKAEEYIKKNPQESRNLVAKYMDLDESVLESFKDEYEVSIHLNLEALLVMMQRVGAWVNNEKPEADRKPLPNYKEFINSQLLRDIDPSRVK